jgi:hypothetical protein
MLDAIRVVVQGHGTPVQASVARDAIQEGNGIVAAPVEGAVPPAPRALPNALLEFDCAALQRWNQLIEPLPENDDARMVLGHYEVSFALDAVAPAESAAELRRRMRIASQVKHTGWGPFVQLGRNEFEPRIVGGEVEAWLGQPVEDRLLRDPAHCDYWRASRSGLFFLLRGYDEDSTDGVEPGTLIDVTLPVWRVGEALLYASRVARTYAENPPINVHCRFTGLRNRRLGAVDRMRRFFMDDTRICHDAEVSLDTAATAAQMDDNIVEILHALLIPLYERFSFFELRLDLVRVEIARMRSNRF